VGIGVGDVFVVVPSAVAVVVVADVSFVGVDVGVDVSDVFVVVPAAVAVVAFYKSESWTKEKFENQEKCGHWEKARGRA